jgi:type IX secretion system PorP/SprF family membrane protein
MKKLYSLLVLLSISVWGQQEPQYTQYMFNPTVINPAYAGSTGYGSFFSMYRAQWVGLEGAPRTMNLGYHQPIENSHLGIGANLLRDEIGPTSTTFAAVDVSYTIAFANESRLAFGIKAGGELFSIDNQKLKNFNPDDPFLQQNMVNQFSPNVGVGLYYYTENSYLGLSVPRLLETRFYDAIAYSETTRKQHVYFVGGKVYDLTYNLKFKPAFVSKIVAGAPLQLDLTANFLYNERFTMGVSYRWDAAVSALLGFKVNNRLSIGYGYDRETTRLANFNSGSHELFLQFDLLKNGQKVETTRFF